MRFKRQFINPAELNTKDAQKSYLITLPATPTNNDIFSYKNVEEIGDKFKIYDNVEVYISGVRVFKGKFRLSETTRDYYKGNLGVPAPISIKDIFGNIFMNQAGKWIIPFQGVTDITRYNNKPDSECIFPLVLYGLLPKGAIEGIYTDKDVYDDSVRLNLDDFPPSVNVIQMLQQIFLNADYTLSGSAISDERLKNLYVSYKNPNEYELQWGVGEMYIYGQWSTLKENKTENKYKTLNSDQAGRMSLGINLFDSANNVTNVITDKGNNIITEKNRIFFTVPVTGLYRLRFAVTYILNDEEADDNTIRVRTGNLDNFNTEIKVLRNFDGNLETLKFDNTFYKNNQNQEAGDERAIFPKSGEVNFIDPLQNKDIICGFSFGRFGDEKYMNPVDTSYTNPMAILGGNSWSANDSNNGTSARAYSATQNTGYIESDGTETGKYKVELDRNTYASRINNQSANGEIYQVVWLNKGDRLDIVDLSFLEYHVGGSGFDRYFYIYNHTVNYSITLEPFQHYLGWLKMDNRGTSNGPMSWDDDPTFETDKIDLIKFLPSNIKVNDWLDNFCKAFNLRLENKGPNRFELNVKNTEIINKTSKLIDLDQKANIAFRTNHPLGVPYMYDLGFTIDNNEEGYIQDMEIDKWTGERILNTGTTGGGQFYTGSYETNAIEQKSFFSYNWFKDIQYTFDNSKIRVPVITEHDIWEFDYDYAEMASNRYFDKAQRFWYKDSVKEFILSKYDDTEIKADLALVSNEYKGHKNLILDYENKKDSIMRSYFLLLTNNRSYTLIDCYLSPEEYTMLPYSLIRFNGDLYHTAEIDGYDPLGKNVGTLKLIKRIY